MDALSNLVDQFFQTPLWQNILSRFEWVDWLAVFFIFVGLIYGARKGFLPMLGDLIQLILVIALTLQFDEKFTQLFETYFGFIPTYAIPSLALLVSALIFWIVLFFIFRLLGKLLPMQTSGLLRFLGGAIGGAIYFFVLLSLLSQALLVGPWPALKQPYQKGASHTGYVLSTLAPNIHSLLTHPTQFFSRKEVQTDALR